MNNLIFFVNKTDSMDIGTGTIYSIVAVIMVFAILLVIIGIMELIFRLTDMINLKKTNNAPINVENENVSQSINHEVVIEDDDMMAACLVASIDYRNETKKDVKVVSIKKL